MNDDIDWMQHILRQYIYGKKADQIWIDEASDMSYSYSRGYYNDTRGDEVATAVLEAYSKGIDFDTLLSKNSQVRAYWGQIQNEKIKQAQSRERQKERERKAAEKRASEKAKREEVMAKLTQEELEALGLVKKGKK
jgi:hypothetical protein